MEGKEHCFELVDSLEEVALGLGVMSAEQRSEAVHLLFRSAHNLKSGLAMAGLTRVSKLVHALEDGLDLIRRGKGRLDTTWEDRIFHAIDLVRNSLQEGNDSTVPVSLDGASAAGATSAAPETAPLPPATAADGLGPGAPRQKAEEAWAHGCHVYRIEKMFTPGLAREAFENHMILDDIRSVGTLLAVVPAYDDYAQSTRETIVRYWFSTTQTAEALSVIFFDPLIAVPRQEPPAAVATGRPSPPPPAPPAPPPARLRALIVEDDFTSRFLLQKYLEAYGEAHIAVNGREAVQAVREALDSGQRYDLICLDIMMPIMDGHAALRAIRSCEEAHHIFSSDGAKILMTTALRSIKDARTAYEGLCDGYLVKPIERHHLVTELRRQGLIT
jgi:two-component system chemotaxis response regulator CheY